MDERSAKRRDWPWLLALLALVLCLRVWHICQTEATARDCIVFVRMALQLDREPYAHVVRNNSQHPLYPLAIWAMSKPLHAYFGRLDPHVMQYAAQTVSLLAALVLVFPTYYLGKFARGPWFGANAVVLFQFLPTPGQYLSDGVSDGLLLCLIASCLYFAVHGFERYRRFDFALAGLCGGLAYLARPEGLLAPLAVLGSLFAFQLRRDWRLSWPRFAWNAGSLTLATLLVASCYFGVTGTITNKPSSQNVMEFGWELPHDDVGPWTNLPGLCAIFFTRTWSSALYGLGHEVVLGFNTGGCVPALIGAIFAWRLMRSKRMVLLTAIYFVGVTLVLARLGRAAGYVSERHVMVLVYLACFATLLGLMLMGRWLLKCLGRTPTIAAVRVASGCLLLVLIGITMPRTLQPLHASRKGNLEAAQWLSQRLKPGDVVDDDYFWTHYYAGGDFLPQEPTTEHSAHYLVVTRSRHDKRVLPKQEPDFRWPSDRPADQAKVMIYRLEPIQAQPVSRPKN